MANLVAVFREVWRVLHPSGVVFLNLGDSYNGSQKGYNGNGTWADRSNVKQGTNHGALGILPTRVDGLKPKDLIGIPWRVAFALQNDGWWLRSDIIWHKKAPMPESVTDRPTKAHEYIFLLTKAAKYFYDAEAIREPHKEDSLKRYEYGLKTKRRTTETGIASYPNKVSSTTVENSERMGDFMNYSGRNKRSVWTLGPESTPIAHFATMPTKLVEPCILAGSSARGVCSECGNPWERVVEKEKVGQLRPMAGSGGVHPQSNYRTHAENGRIVDETSTLNHIFTNTTTGWTPTCQCQADIVPATVLDPFAGAGTTLLVANRLGRNSIGIELNPEYVKLATERLERSQPMLTGLVI